MTEPIAFDTTQITSDKNYSRPRPGDPCHPLAARAHAPAVALGGGVVGEPTPLRASGAAYANGAGIGREGDPSLSLDTDGSAAVAFHQIQDPITGNEFAPSLGANSHGMGVSRGMQVRRLTPRECERLMGWPDDHTALGNDGKPVSDSHRYRMCGNGVVSDVAEWIGRRLIVANGC